MKTIKNKINQILSTTTIALTLTALISCEKQPTTNNTNTPNDLTISLQAPSGMSVDVETKAATIGDIYIGSVWVFQFGADGTMKKVQYRGSDKITPKANGSHLAEVETDGFINEDSRFYIIANGGSSMFTESNTYTESDVMKVTKAAGSDITSEFGFLTAGPIEFKKQEVDNNKAVLVAPLERAYAKISLRYNVDKLTNGATFKASKATITNFPTVMAVSRRGGGDLNTSYPTYNTSNININEQDIAGTTVGWQPNIVKSVYIPENLRGIGKSTTFAGKNFAANGPGSSLDGCTYVTIKGLYKYNQAHTGGIEVEYRFYLGGNLMNDYNIQRGTSYTITVNIAGANSADIRVTITKGNVVVFDKVEEIESVVDFN